MWYVILTNYTVYSFLKFLQGHDVEELIKVKEEIEKERKRLEELRQITNPTNN